MANVETKPEVVTASRVLSVTKPELALGGRGTDTSGGTPPTGDATVAYPIAG